jgi:signal transduction histidine kinase
MTPEQKRLLEIMIQEADQMNGLIGDLLDLASIEAGGVELDRRPVSLDEVIQKALPRVKLALIRPRLRRPGPLQSPIHR